MNGSEPRGHSSYGTCTTGCYDILEGEITLMFHDREASIRSLALAALLCGAIGCRQSETPPDSADTGKSPQDTLQGMMVAEGLEVTLFAAEPDLRNPTSMDVVRMGPGVGY